LSVTHDPAVVMPGGGALKFGYSVKKGEMGALVFPVTEGTLTRAETIKFRVKTDSTTTIAVILQEQDGGRYVAMCRAPQDKWQPIELSVHDFILSQDKDDPKDPDGVLDMDKVSGIAIGDISQMLVQSNNDALTSLFGLKTGSHAMFVDGFSVETGPIGPGPSDSKIGYQIDTFRHPQLGWIALGGVVLEQTEAKPLDLMGLKADYRQTPGKFAALSRAISPGSLKHHTALTFNAASLHKAKLLVQVEDIAGGKYNTVLDLPEGSALTPFNLAFSSFKPADDTGDPNGTLDPAKIKTLLFIDTSGMVDQADIDNTLWINRIIAKP
jgi:hypothetical protein